MRAALTVVAGFALASLAAWCPAVEDATALRTPELLAIRDAFVRDRSAADAARRDQLRALLRKYLAEAEETLREKQSAQNIKGIAVATHAKQIFEDSLGALEQQGQFDFPQKVRRELEATMAECQKEKARIESAHSNELARIESAALSAFGQALRKSSPGLAADADALRRLFLDFARADTPATAAATAATAAPATNAPPASLAEPAPPLLPDTIAASGEGGPWIPVAQWTGEMMALDVVSIPVFNRYGETVSHVRHVLSQQQSTLTYKSLRTLPPRGDYVFRIQRRPGVEPVDLLEWPTARNAYSLVVRTHPPVTVPLVHGFELQVSLPPSEMNKVFPADEIAAAPTPAQIRVTIATRPTNATVFVNGAAYSGAGGPARTPCVITLPAGVHSLQVSLPGYLDTGVRGHSFTADTQIAWTLPEDPRVIRRVIKVPAKGKWTPSNVRIPAGSEVTLEVSGEWSCGSRKEMCGPEGYPNDSDFYHYYLDPSAGPRQVAKANYGALLFKLNVDGTPRPLGRRMVMTVREEGTLFFDINESDRGRERADNTGSLEVKMTVFPPRPAG